MDLGRELRREAVKTLDLTLGGFALMLDQPPRVGDRMRFTIALRDGPLSGEARVVNVQRKGRPYRVGFAFEALPPAAAARIGFEVLDGVISLVGDR